MTMQLTRRAHQLLDRLPDDRRAVVGNRAERIAYAKRKRWVGVEEIKSALLYAGDEFIDTPDKSHEGDNP